MRKDRGVLGAGLALVVLAGPVTAQDLTDPEVAHVAVTANAIDVELARVALELGTSASVKGFAQMMIDDHTGVNEQAAALAKKLGVTPAANDVSASLRSGADEAKGELTKLSGAAFDRAYMDREVAYHQAVLGALDDLLIPTTENAELKGLLEVVWPAIAAHLARAQEIRRTLGG